MIDYCVKLNTLRQKHYRDLEVEYQYESNGPDHEKKWRAKCFLGKRGNRSFTIDHFTEYSDNWHNSKNEAKQAAAAAMLNLLAPRYVGL